MSLLGAPLLIILVVVALALPAVCVWVWPKVRGHRPLRVAQRLGMLVCAQLVAVLAIGVALNDYGDFYGSWSALFSSGPHNARISAPVSPAPTPSSPPVAHVHTGTRTNAPGAPPARSAWSRLGRSELVEISGTTSRLHERADVYLPPQYFQAHYANTRFPVIVALSSLRGGIGELQGGRHGVDAPAAVRADIEQRRIGPTVLVLISPDLTPPRDTECTDVPAGPQAESFLTRDLPVQLPLAFRVRPVGWGAIGIGTGGYCAVKLAMTSPGVYYAAVSVDGYFSAVENRQTGNLWGGSSVLRDENDLIWRLQHQPAPPVSVLAVSSGGKAGLRGDRDLQRFATAVRHPMTIDRALAPTTVTLSTWRHSLPQELAWLAHRLPGGAAL